MLVNLATTVMRPGTCHNGADCEGACHVKESGGGARTYVSRRRRATHYPQDLTTAALWVYGPDLR